MYKKSYVHLGAVPCIWVKIGQILKTIISWHLYTYNKLSEFKQYLLVQFFSFSLLFLLSVVWGRLGGTETLCVMAYLVIFIMSGPQTLRIISKVVYTRSDQASLRPEEETLLPFGWGRPALRRMFHDTLFLRTGTFQLQHRESSWTLLSLFCVEKIRKNACRTTTELGSLCWRLLPGVCVLLVLDQRTWEMLCKTVYHTEWISNDCQTTSSHLLSQKTPIPIFVF